MAISAKNLSNPTRVGKDDEIEYAALSGEVVKSARRIQPPDNYYTGIQTELNGIPNNVIVFCRCHVSELVGEGHVHHRYVLIIPLETAGTVVVDSKAHYLSPGHAIVLFPYQFHYYADLGDNQLTWLFITFELNDGEPIRELKDSPRKIPDQCWYDLARLTTQYHTIQRNGQVITNDIHLRAAILVHGLVGSHRLRSRTDTPSGTASGKTDLLAAVGQYVFSRINQPISVTELARHLNMSPSNLRNHFRRRYKMGVAYYIRHTKMLQAMRMLRFTQMSITEIAEQCGYPSVYSFSRSFKQETGQSPRDYRNRE